MHVHIDLCIVHTMLCRYIKNVGGGTAAAAAAANMMLMICYETIKLHEQFCRFATRSDWHLYFFLCSIIAVIATGSSKSDKIKAHYFSDSFLIRLMMDNLAEHMILIDSQRTDPNAKIRCNEMHKSESGKILESMKSQLKEIAIACNDM